MNKYYIIFLIILIIFVFLLKDKMNKKDNVAIILTCTVNVDKNINILEQQNPEQRKNIYIKSIKKWLNNTSFIIIVVDNSGYTFPELNWLKYKNRLEIISYNESDLPDYQLIKNDKSKGIHEIYAINYAYINSNLIKKCNFIIKVTGRYYIPTLKNYNFDVDFIRQNNNEKCEIVGCDYKHFNYLFNKKINYIDNEYNNDFIEIIYKRRIDASGGKVFQLPSLKIEDTMNGGNNSLVNIL